MHRRSPVWMLNPQSNTKKRMVGHRLSARGRSAADFTEQAVKEKLKAIRDLSAEHLEDLVDQLAQTCQEQYGITPFHADTAQSAAQYVLDVAKAHRQVAVNRSATVNEIRPALLECGLAVIDSYDEEFEHPDSGIRYYWELELPEPEAAWESFGHPKPAPQPRVSGNTVAVIGVNTASAADGTVYLVEHLRNVTRMLREAEKVVLVVGLDKIAPTAEDARFVAQAMGLFGAPSVAMTASSRGYQEPAPGTDEDLSPGTALDQEWHIILLDNHRRWLLTSPFDSLFTCIGCRACLRECPTFPYLGHNPGLSPRDQLWMALRGEEDSTADCVACQRCKALCPLGIDLPLLLSEVKRQHPKLRDQFFKRINVLFALSSATAPVSNLAFSVPPVRVAAEWVSGMDRRRELPRFHRQSFAGWSASRTSRPANGSKVVYYYGCYVNYTDPDLGRIVVDLLERNGCDVATAAQTCCGVAAFWQGDRTISERYARETIDSLLPWVDKGYQVLVSCPSCGLALVQDFLHLFPGDEGAARLAASTVDAPTFILKLAAEGRWIPPRSPVDLKVGYHTPCHLRIRGKGEDTLALLSSIEGLEVANVDRGCCGLAGSYGMKAKNYDKAMAVGGRVAEFLADNQLDAVTTDCAGCEMQLHAVSGLPAYHPLKLLWKGYGESLDLTPYHGVGPE